MQYVSLLKVKFIYLLHISWYHIIINPVNYLVCIVYSIQNYILNAKCCGALDILPSLARDQYQLFSAFANLRRSIKVIM